MGGSGAPFRTFPRPFPVGKLAVLDSLLHRLKANGSRVLLFSSFTQTLDLLEDFLRWRAFGPHLRMDGSTHPVQRELDLIKCSLARNESSGSTNRIQRELDMREFNAPGSPHFAYLISTRAGGVGINLATADAVVLFEPDWNPQIDLQATDRALPRPFLDPS